MQHLDAKHRVDAIAAIIPRPPEDIAPVRNAFSRTIASQWQRYVPDALAQSGQGLPDSQFAKSRFIAEMYARGCYSMLLVSASGPPVLRILVKAATTLPLSRAWVIRLGSGLLVSLPQLVSTAFHRQTLLLSAMMGMLDLVLDVAAVEGDASAFRVASLVTDQAPDDLMQKERAIATLACAARQGATVWQEKYWVGVLEPAVREYCREEVLGVQRMPDSTGMGHRSAGITGVVKGMWYVVGPQIGLRGDLARFERTEWNREQQWMADTTLLMQMIDDWVDQDEDRTMRLTPVVDGTWTLETARRLYQKTLQDLNALLDASGIQNPVFKALFIDLYTDYLHTALGAMRSGIAV